MNQRCFAPLLALAMMAAVPLRSLAANPRPDDAFAKQASWKQPTAVEVRATLFALLADRPAEDPARQSIEAAWAGAEGWTDAVATLSHLTESFAVLDPRAKELVEFCNRPRSQVALPEFAVLTDEKTPAFERDNLRLVYGRWLVQERLIDEALLQLEPLRVEQVVDPASLLFYQAVVFHRLLMKKPGLDAIARLREREADIPRRFVSVATLMQADLEPLKDDTLDHISRRMDDIRRRLDLGRAGPKVREVEDGVIRSLDKLIEDMEDQAAQAASKMGAGGQGSLQPSAPAQDSVPAGGKGPGMVTKKDIGHQSGWGDLPPKERQEALQQIGKDFPPHYRDVVEQYFRKLANQDSEQP